MIMPYCQHTERKFREYKKKKKRKEQAIGKTREEKITQRDTRMRKKVRVCWEVRGMDASPVTWKQPREKRLRVDAPDRPSRNDLRIDH